MRQDIIDKYGLIKTDIQNGESFMSNVTIYQHPRKDVVLYFSMGDHMGKRLMEGFVGIMAIKKVDDKKYWLTFQVPEELLMDDEGEKFLETRIAEDVKKWLD